MNSPISPSGAARGLHLLLAAAAISVIALCSVGVAALAGWLPAPWADPVTAEQAAAEQATAAQTAAAQVAAQTQQVKPAAASAKVPPPASAKVAAGPSSQPPAPRVHTCPTCGVVDTVRQVQAPAQNNGHNILGTVAGGVVGGVVGHQFGGGSGKDALTVLGAVGGALAGHQIERNIRSQQTVSYYELTVRMADGSSRLFRSAQPFPFVSGDPVRVENDQLLPG